MLFIAFEFSAIRRWEEGWKEATPILSSVPSRKPPSSNYFPQCPRLVAKLPLHHERKGVQTDCHNCGSTRKHNCVVQQYIILHCSYLQQPICHFGSQSSYTTSICETSVSWEWQEMVIEQLIILPVCTSCISYFVWREVICWVLLFYCLCIFQWIFDSLGFRLRLHLG